VDPSISIDIANIPFSRYGAYVSLTAEKNKKPLTIHYLRKRGEQGLAFELILLKDSRAVDYELKAAPEQIICTAIEGSVQIYIRDDETLTFYSSGLNLYFRSLDSYSYGTEDGEHKFRVIFAGRKNYSLFRVFTGHGIFMGPMIDNRNWQWNGIPVNHKKDICFRCEKNLLLMALKLSMVESEDIPNPILPDKEVEEIRREWKNFLKKMPKKDILPPKTDPQKGTEEEKEFQQITWYNLWSSYVRAWDVYHHDTMLMSKKWMNSVWSWDHCFNALAMAGIEGNKEEAAKKALEQFMASFPFPCFFSGLCYNSLSTKRRV
jgi:hypothetical protein